ncbi:SRPBCC family protein [Novosphingobium panipatense]
MEVLPGATRYRYRGNWKMQVENGLDGYHVGTVHANYFMTVMRRVEGPPRTTPRRSTFQISTGRTADLFPSITGIQCSGPTTPISGIGRISRPSTGSRKPMARRRRCG